MITKAPSPCHSLAQQTLCGIKPSFLDWYSRFYTILLQPFLRTWPHKPRILTNLVYTPPSVHVLQVSTLASLLSWPGCGQCSLFIAHQKPYPSPSFVHCHLLHSGQKGSWSSLMSLHELHYEDYLYERPGYSMPYSLALSTVPSKIKVSDKQNVKYN